MDQYDYDAIVIGAGFGGLGAALTLAESGLKVGLLEALNYPGGCASTFTRRGYAFESGATLFSGFADGMYFEQVIQRYNLPVTIDWIDPLVEIRTPGWNLPVGRSREALVEALVAQGVPEVALRAFLEMQRSVADILWGLFDDPDLLPPWNAAALLRHLTRLPRYTKLVSLVGRSLYSVLKRYNLENEEPLTTFLNALCQITIQTELKEAEAPFALATMDYYFRGTGHVRDGIGSLATSMVTAFERAGGTMHYTTRVKGLEQSSNGWEVKTTKGSLTSRFVLGNLLPHAAEQLCPQAPTGSRNSLKKRLDSGWGAAMLYLGINHHEGLPDKATHIEAIRDPSKPFIEGNHIFASLSGLNDQGRAPEGQRTLTVSTHVPFPKYSALSGEEQGRYIASIQASMHDTLGTLAPELSEHIAFSMTASPRTFERFTKRPLGRVGGVPRRVGLQNYLTIGPTEYAPGFFLVGDSAFPGQSTLACALGGHRAATKVLRKVGEVRLIEPMRPEPPETSAPQHLP